MNVGAQHVEDLQVGARIKYLQSDCHVDSCSEIASTSSEIASLDATTTSVKSVDWFSQDAAEKDCCAKSRCDGESPMMATLRGAKGMRRHRWHSDDKLVRVRIVLGTKLTDNDLDWYRVFSETPDGSI